MQLLDYDTGGGEFLLSLGHPYRNTAATEGYPPNVELCRQVLLPLGVDFRPCDDPKKFRLKRGDLIWCSTATVILTRRNCIAF